MRTSTSNSDGWLRPAVSNAAPRWLSTWICTGVLAALTVVGAHELGGKLSIAASVESDPALWATARQRVATTEGPQIVFVGASRSAFGTDLGIVEQALPGVAVTQLAIRGANWTPVLADLAREPPRQGWVVVSLAGPSLEPVRVARSTEYVHFYRTQWKAALALERSIDSFIQARSRAPRTVDELVRRARQAYLGTRQWVDRSVTTPDRQVFASASHLRQSIAGKAKADRRRIYQQQRQIHALSVETWRRELGCVLDDVDRLSAAGVRVAFVRYPSSDPHLEVERQYYPRADFWDVVEAECDARGCVTLHYEDVPRLRHFVAEDGSHLPEETRGAFTEALVESLQEIGFLPR